MSYKLSYPIHLVCIECPKEFETHWPKTKTCGPACARARKSRLQKERRYPKPPPAKTTRPPREQLLAQPGPA